MAKPVTLPAIATISRWCARILACAILGFCGFFIIAHLVGDAGAPSRPLTPNDVASLTAFIASLAGLGLSLKWERGGATVTLAAVLTGAAFNYRVLLSPMALIPVTAVVFVLSSYARSISFDVST